jgi:hypothetical protein
MGHMGQNLCEECRLRPICGKAAAIAPVVPNGCASFSEIVTAPGGWKVAFEDAPEWLLSCDRCDSIENGHYCLLHSIGLKNANLIRCKDWSQMDKN